MSNPNRFFTEKLAEEVDELRRVKADLLAALERIAADLEMYADEIEGTDEEGLARSTADRIRAAIAKATEGGHEELEPLLHRETG